MGEPKIPLSDDEIADLLPTLQAGWTLSDYGMWVARAVERAHGIATHQWAPPNGVVRWPHCTVCGVIQRRDGHQSNCKGPIKVVLRDGQ